MNSKLSASIFFAHMSSTIDSLGSAIRPILCGALSLGLCLTTASTAVSADLTFSGSTVNASENNSLNASAVFDLTGSILTLSLFNVDTTGVRVPTDVLTGLAFNANTSLTALSATVLQGNLIFSNGSTNGTVLNTNTNVASGWGYSNNINVRGATQGISASGAFTGLGQSLNGTNLQGLASGLVGTGGIASNANNGVTGNQPLYQNSVVFQFSVGNDFNLNSISNLSFQYGTNTSEPSANGVPVADVIPEPAPLLATIVFSFVLGGVLLVKRRAAIAE